MTTWLLIVTSTVKNGNDLNERDIGEGEGIN